MHKNFHTIALSFIPKVGAVAARNLISYCGSAEAVFKQKKSQLLKIPGIGALLAQTQQAAELLNATVVDMRFIKPLDEALIKELLETHDLLVTLEENAIQGGAGSAVCEYLNSIYAQTPVLQLGLPDRFVNHGTHAELLTECGLDAMGINDAIKRRISQGLPSNRKTVSLESL